MKKYLLVVFAISMVLLACKSKSENKNDGAPGKTAEIKVNQNALVLMDVSIKGMTCTECENTIKSCIVGLPGVVDVSASFVDGRALVKLDTTLTKMDKISKAVKNRGYTVTGHKLAAKVPGAQ